MKDREDFTISFFQFEEAAKTVADELTQPRPKGEETMNDIQVMFNLDDYPSSVRNVKVPNYITKSASIPFSSC